MDLGDRESNFPLKWMSLRILGRAYFDPDVKNFLTKKTRTAADESLKKETIRSLGFVRADSDVNRFLLAQLRNATALPLKVALAKSLYFAVLDEDKDAVKKIHDLKKDENEELRLAAHETLSQDAEVFAKWICPDNFTECSPAHNGRFWPRPRKQ